MDFGEALYQALAGQASSGEPTSFRAAIDHFRDTSPSTSALAREMGVPRSTLRGWLAGRTPKGGRPDLVDQARAEWRRDALPRGKEARMRADWSTDGLTVVGTYSYDDAHSEDREVRIGEYMNDVGADLVDAFLDGASPNDLWDIAHDAINDHGWYADTFERESPDPHQWDVDEITGWG